MVVLIEDESSRGVPAFCVDAEFGIVHSHCMDHTILGNKIENDLI